MANVVIVTGSVRPNSVNEKIVPEVEKIVKQLGATPEIANLGKIGLPFFDAPFPPNNPDYKPTNDAAKEWTQLVADADGVIFVTPEYNHTLSPIQLNAIDWIGKEWEDKPVALVGYGWTSGAGQAHATARESLGVNLKANIGEKSSNLFFGKDLNPDGTIADTDAVESKITESVKELLEIIEK